MIQSVMKDCSVEVNAKVLMYVADELCCRCCMLLRMIMVLLLSTINGDADELALSFAWRATKSLLFITGNIHL